MKSQFFPALILPLICSLFLLIFSCGAIYAANDETSAEAVDLLVKAYQNSGFNLSVISSGRAEFEVVTEHQGDVGIPEEFKEHGVTSLDTKQRYKYFFSGNDKLNIASTKPYLRYYDFFDFPPSLDTWVNVQTTLALGRLNQEDACVSIRMIPNNKMVFLKKGFFSYADYQKFGRFRETGASTASLLIRDKIDRSDFSLPQDFADYFLAEFANRNLEIKITGEVEYDSGHHAKVVEVTKDGKIHEKYHIDASRGYICPYIEIYHLSGMYSQVSNASNYIQEKNTKLFYPTKYVISRDDTGLGLGKSVKSYQLLPDTLLFNQKISDREFALDIPVGTLVTDELAGEPVKYQAVQKGVLFLTKGGIDLSEMDWLVREEDVDSYIPPQGGARGHARWVLAVGGLVIVIVIVVYTKLKKREN